MTLSERLRELARVNEDNGVDAELVAEEWAEIVATLREAADALDAHPAPSPQETP